METFSNNFDIIQKSVLSSLDQVEVCIKQGYKNKKDTTDVLE